MVGPYANQVTQIPVHPHPNQQLPIGAFNVVQQSVFHDPAAMLYPNLSASANKVTI